MISKVREGGPFRRVTVFINTGLLLYGRETTHSFDIFLQETSSVPLQHFCFLFQLFYNVLQRKLYLLVHSSPGLLCNVASLFLNQSSSKISLFPDWDAGIDFTGRANYPSLCMHEKPNKPKRLAMFLLHAFSPPISPLSFLLFNYMHPFFGVHSLIFNMPLA